MSVCDAEDGSLYAGHRWEYGTAQRSREPYRACQCGRVEVYYLDDLALEREMGIVPN